MQKDNIPRGYVKNYWLAICIVLLIGVIAWHYIERSQNEKAIMRSANSRGKEDQSSPTGIPPDSLHH